MERRRSFVSEPSVIGDARRMVADALADAEFAEEPCFVATLLASELVTNAVLHARTGFDMVVTIDAQRARIAVKDRNTRLPQPALAPNDATTGRGLKMVDALASAWGTERTAAGKIVWFDVVASA